MSCSFKFQGRIFSDSDPPDEGIRLAELRGIAKRCGNDALHVLEWGSGLSTLTLDDEIGKRKAGGAIVTIDHMREWQTAVLDSIVNQSLIRGIHASLDGFLVANVQDVSYSNVPLDLIRKEQVTWPWDLIVIDGRRRIECAYVAALVSRPHTLIALHDYRRLRYQHIVGLLEVVEDGPHYRVMRASPDLIRKTWTAWSSPL